LFSFDSVRVVTKPRKRRGAVEEGEPTVRWGATDGTAGMIGGTSVGVNGLSRGFGPELRATEQFSGDTGT
jgi:hypothetical protein